MKNCFTILAIILCSISFAQQPSIEDIEAIAFNVNEKIKGVALADGIEGMGCRSSGRTIIFEYEVSKDWEPFENNKEVIIRNLKEDGTSRIYMAGDLRVEYIYYRRDEIIEQITIEPEEFGEKPTSNPISVSRIYHSLDAHLSLKDHPKSKGVNMEIRPPTGWEVKDGNRPNILKTFSKSGVVYTILIKENIGFVSRNEAKKTFEDKTFTDGLLTGVVSYFENPRIIQKAMVTIDTYPALEFTVIGEKEQMGSNLKMTVKNWAIFYEDKFIYLQGTTSEEDDFKSIEPIFNHITNSVIFPDQYE